MSLTFNEIGFPIAEIISEGELIYLNPKKERAGPSKIENLDLEILEEARQSIEQGASGDEVMEILESQLGQPGVLGDEFEAEDDEQIMFFPSISSERVYIAGMAGMGKSWIAKEYAIRYKMMFPDNQIVLISRHDDDETYEDGVEMDHLLADENLLEEDFSLENLRDKLLIFDDMDNLPPNSPISKYVQRLVDDLVCNSRKYNVYIIYISHMIMNYGKTRSILNEANKVIIFPSNSIAANVGFMKKYGGFTKEQINKVNKLKGISRWACICRSCIPAYVVHEKGIFLV
jgi:hypothetical protein